MHKQKSIITKLHNKTILYLIGCSCIIYLSCVTSLNQEDAYEGIRNNILRVYVKWVIPDDIDRKDIQKMLNENLMEFGKQRAAFFLMNYMQMNIQNSTQIQQCYEAVDSILKHGNLLYKKCNDEFCQGYIDYNLQEFKKCCQLIE